MRGALDAAVKKGWNRSDIVVGVKNIYYSRHGINFGTKIIKIGQELTKLWCILFHTRHIFNGVPPQLYDVSKFDGGSDSLEKLFVSEVYIKN